MIALGVGLVWLSYAAILYSYCLIRGYDITPMQLVSPNWPPSKAASK